MICNSRGHEAVVNLLAAVPAGLRDISHLVVGWEPEVDFSFGGSSRTNHVIGRLAGREPRVHT